MTACPGSSAPSTVGAATSSSSSASTAPRSAAAAAITSWVLGLIAGSVDAAVPSVTHAWPPAARAAAVRDAAAAGLDRLLADLAAWVDTRHAERRPRRARRLRRDLAARLRALRLRARARASAPAGLHLHARLRGRGRRARWRCSSHHDTVFPPGTAAARPFAMPTATRARPRRRGHEGRPAPWPCTPARLLARRGLPVGTLELVSVPDEEPRSAPLRHAGGWRASTPRWCWSAAGPATAIVTARKGGRWLELHATGRRAHAGTEPERGRNAVLALCARGAAHRRACDGARPGLGVQVTRLRGGEGHQHRARARRVLSLDVRGLEPRRPGLGHRARSSASARTTASRSRWRRREAHAAHGAAPARRPGPGADGARPRRSARPCTTWRPAAPRTAAWCASAPASRRWTGSGPVGGARPHAGRVHRGRVVRAALRARRPGW